MAIAYLSSPHGQEIQQRAYDEIMQVYPEGDAWERCLVEEKVPYITAFVKEVLRFWTVIPISLPRKSMKEIQWQGAKIPAGTTFYMVCSPLHPLVTDKLNSDPRVSSRTPTPQTTTPPTSKIPTRSTLTATSLLPAAPVPPIMVMAPAPACASARTWPTASSTPPLSG